MRIALVLGTILLGGCAEAPPPVAAHPEALGVEVATVQPAPIETIPAPAHLPGTIDRATLVTIIDAGLGRFFQQVETAPVRERGRFVGFRVTALHSSPLIQFESSGLQVGDVVHDVNGMAIETPDQAFAAWTSLRTASQVVVAITRGTEARILQFPVTEPVSTPAASPNSAR